MKTKVFQNEVIRKRLYLSEFQCFDGEEFITMNIIDIYTNTKQITVAVTNSGRISVITYELSLAKSYSLEFSPILQ